MPRSFGPALNINEPITVLASVARTASPLNTDNVNPGARGVVLTLDITAVSGTSPTLDVKAQGKCPASGKYVDIAGAAFAQKTGAFTGTLTIYPGIAETANVSVSDVLPNDWRIVSTIGGTATPTFTYSIGAQLIG